MRKLSIKQKSYGIFSLLFLAVFISGMVILLSLSHTKEDAEIINALGRQRMLAQEMAQSVFGFSMAKEQKKNLEQQILSLDHYITQMRSTYTESVIKQAQKAGITVSMHPTQDTHPAIPFPATFTRLVNEAFGDSGGFSANIISENPVNPKQTLKSELDKEANVFFKSSSEKFFSKIIEENGKLILRLYSPDRATVSACVTCHSALQQKIIKAGDILGIRSYKLIYSENADQGKAELDANLNQYVIAKTMFEFTHWVIKLGGKFPLDRNLSKWKKIKAIPDANAQIKLLEIEKVYHALVESVDTLLNLETNSMPYRRARQEIVDQSNALRKLSSQLVDIYERVAKKNHNNIKFAVAIAGVFTLAILLILARYFTAMVIKPIQKISKVLTQTSKGNLIQPELPVNSNDEIGALSQSCNELTKGLQRFIRYSEFIHIGKLETSRCDLRGDFKTSLEKMSATAKAKQSAERALQEAQIDLEHRVQGRTSELLKSNDSLLKEITLRIKTENSLQQTNSFLQNLLESPTEISIISTDMEENILYWNKGAEKMLGYSADELVGQRKVDFLYAKGSKNNEKRREAAHFVIKFKKATTLTLKEKTKSGNEIWVKLTLSPRLDDKGDVVGLLGIGENITSQKLAEMELSLSEGRLRSLVDNALDGIISIDIRGIVESFNQAAEKIFGYPKEEIIGQNISMLMPEPHRSQHDGYIEKYLATGEKRFLGMVRELSGVRKNGEVFPLEISANPIDLGDKRIFMGITRDITERKKAEKELRSFNESLKKEITERKRAEDLAARFGRILDQSSNEIYIFNEHNLKFAQVNSGALKNLGYSMEEMSELTPLDLKPEFTLEQFEAFIQPLSERKKSELVFESVHKRKDGSLYPVEVHLQLSQTEMPQLFVAIIQDISQRKESEKALRASEEKAQLVIDTANDAFVSINSNGQIIEWNNKAEEIFGWRRDEVLGKKISETIIPVSCREQHKAGLENFLETGKSKVLNTRVELNALHREGHEFPVEISISPLPVDGSYQFNAFIQDITERKSIQTQLHHAQKMESIGHLAAGIAHEINTPMQFVGDNTMFLQNSFNQIFGTVKAHDRLLMECKKGTVSEKMVEDVEASIQDNDIEYLFEEIPLAIQQSLEGVERVSHIVKAMKEFSHPGSEDRIPTDINKAIETTLTVARNEWKYLAKVVTDFDPDLPLVPCFVNDFNQIILNTVVNAAHAIGEVVKNSGDLGTITLSTRKDGDWAEVRIQDSGTGIPEDIKAKIFDPFFTTKEVGKGTGQGLAIVHAIVVKKHQGAVSLETEQGKGTTFIFRLPISSTYSQIN